MPQQPTDLAAAEAMWRACHASLGETAPQAFDTDHFCDNENDCDELAELVRTGVKRGTASSVQAIEADGINPVPGYRWVVTTWSGQPICVVETVKVTQLRFCDVTAEHAAIEGEGDGSLAYWRRVHEAFYRRDPHSTFSPEMMVCFEEFRCIYPAVASKD